MDDMTIGFLIGAGVVALHDYLYFFHGFRILPEIKGKK